MTISMYPPADTTEQDLLDYFGDGSLGDVSIVGTVVLTSDVQYRNLVVPPSAVLVTNGWFVRASQSITVEVGGIIHADGTNGYPGWDNNNGTGYGGGGGQGGGVVALYTPTLVMQGTVRANGGNGGESTTTTPSGTVRNGGGLVDNGGGGGGAGNTNGTNGGTATAGVGRTNGGPGKAGQDFYGYRARGGGPGGHGFVANHVYEVISVGGGGVGVAGLPYPPAQVPEYFAGGSGGLGGSGQGYFAAGGTTWGRGGTHLAEVPPAKVTTADIETWQSFRSINVPYFYKGRPGARPATYGGGGGGGGSGYYQNPGGAGGGGLIITCTKSRSGAGTYQVNPGVAGAVSSSIGGYPGPSVAAAGNVFHFTYRD